MRTKEKAAVMVLFEELYNSANDISPGTIYDSIEIMMSAYDFEDFLFGIDPDMINVVHHKHLDEANKEINRLETLVFDLKESIENILKYTVKTD